MSHDTHQEHSAENTTIISFKSGFWLVVIIVGLFVSALNFIQAESGGEGAKGEAKEKKEMSTGKEAGAEKMEKKAEEPKAAEAAGKDAAGKEGK